jgi:hypothetical protein
MSYIQIVAVVVKTDRDGAEAMFEQAIEKKREEMKYFVQRYGITAKKTVHCSQELDKLLNILLFLQCSRRLGN